MILRLIVTDGRITEREMEHLNRSFELDHTLPELEEVYRNCEGELICSFDENSENAFPI